MKIKHIILPVFIALVLFLYQSYIFYPMIEYIHNQKLRFINTDSIITATTVGVSLGLNAPALSKKIQSLFTTMESEGNSILHRVSLRDTMSYDQVIPTQGT